MTKVLLRNGPCDPREVEMNVTNDATAVRVRPMPFTCYDVYAVVDRFIDDGVVTHATGEYMYTSEPRSQRDAYRRRLLQFGTGSVFKMKTKREMHAH